MSFEELEPSVDEEYQPVVVKENKPKKKGKSIFEGCKLCECSKTELSTHLRGKFLRNSPGSSELELAFLEYFINYQQNIKSLSSHVVSELKTHKGEGFSILIITISAIRAVEILHESLTAVRKLTPVAKLFAKHIKLQEQQQFVKHKKPRIAVGTPGRILSLIQADESMFMNVEWLLIDTKQDSKSRTVFDMPETCSPLQKLLSSNWLERLRKGELKIGFFN